MDGARKNLTSERAAAAGGYVALLDLLLNAVGWPSPGLDIHRTGAPLLCAQVDGDSQAFESRLVPTGCYRTFRLELEGTRFWARKVLVLTDIGSHRLLEVHKSAVRRKL